MANRDIIVVGASAGGVEALMNVVSQLPANFSASMFVVQHLNPHHDSFLRQILQRHTVIPVSNPEPGEAVRPGQIYVAPPDHHLILHDDSVLLTRGPKENGFRPSVDVLFRSAAAAFGPRVIGLILTGVRDDGASGMYAIKKQGGVAVAQDPVEAEFPDMPLNAMRAVKVDHSVSLSQFGNLLTRLISTPIEKQNASKPSETMKAEVNIAKEDNAIESGVMQIGEKTSLTCPECHGALGEIREGDIVRFRCHTGHAYGFETLAEEVSHEIEMALWLSLNKIEETEMLMNRAAKVLRQTGEERALGVIEEQIRLARQKSNLVRQAVLLPKNGGSTLLKTRSDRSAAEHRA
jgi:two-component system chemotaxis response regulator CheB